MSNKMKYYVIFNNGMYEVKSKDLLIGNDIENIVYGPCTAQTACHKADELEEEYINENNLVDTRHYFEDMKYKASMPPSSYECDE